MIPRQQHIPAAIDVKFPCPKDNEPVKRLQTIKMQFDVNFILDKFTKIYNSLPSE
jgi:hypothetical protein